MCRVSLLLKTLLEEGNGTLGLLQILPPVSSHPLQYQVTGMVCWYGFYENMHDLERSLFNSISYDLSIYASRIVWIEFLVTSSF